MNIRLYTDMGEVALPADFSIAMDKNSPFFSKEGEQSIPINIPVTNSVNSYLYNNLRFQKSNLVISVNAFLQIGMLRKVGKLVFSSFSKHRIAASFITSESDLYADYGDKNIKELFSDHFRNDFSNIPDWIEYFRKVLLGHLRDDFTLIPVFTNKKDNDVFVINKPDTDRADGTLIYKRRLLQNEEVPDGYGVSPFLYLNRFLELLFSKLGYTLVRNDIATIEGYNNLILLNNNADSICKGRLCYRDLVPSCSVNDLIEWLDEKFKAAVFVDSEKKDVKIITFSAMCKSTAELDLSDYIDIDSLSINLEKSKDYSIVSDTSIEGAAPAADSLSDFIKKYPYVKKVNEEEFLNNNNPYTILLRVATGAFYWVERKFCNNKTFVTRTSKIGSNYFSFSGSSAGGEIKPKDLIPPMVIYSYPENNYMNILSAYIGNRINLNTSFANEKEKKEEEQKIIIVKDAGLSIIDEKHRCLYRLGTTQGYDNIGELIEDKSLNSDCLGRDFFTEFFSVSKAGLANIDVKLVFENFNFLNLKLDKPVMISGQKCIPSQINYELSDVVGSSESSKFILIKNSSKNIVIPEFLEQKFKWVFSFDPPIEGESYIDPRLEIDESENDGYRYIPAPTTLGEKMIINIFVRMYGKENNADGQENNNEILIFSGYMDCNLVAVPI